MDLAQVMKEFVNNESVLKFKSLVGKHEEIARRNGRREGIQEGKREGRASGLAEGTQMEKHKIAKNLLNDHLNIEKIMQYTGLSKREILKLQEN